jgi:hypothetical protein
MKNILPRFFLLLLIITFSCQSSNERGNQSDEDVPERDEFALNFKALSTAIMERANLQPGERVVLVARPGEFDSLVLLLKQQISDTNAEYLGTFSVTDGLPNDWQTEFTRSASGKSLEELASHFHAVDLGIMLPGADTTHVPYAAMQKVLRTGKGRTIHFHWAGAYQMNGSLLPRSESVDKLYQTALLNTDYSSLARQQARFEEAVRKDPIRVTTPLGTDIRFSIGDRPVTKQDGDASKSRTSAARNFIDREIELPAGAVRVAPIEETVEGRIVFPPMNWNGVTVKDLVMTFKAGKIISVKAAEGLGVVQSELKKAGPVASSFRELAVGFNPWLAIPEIGPQWIPYYGYGAGVIRLSLGDNTELGGKVGGGYVRWNFFTDATVRVGDVVWINNGELVMSNE